MNDIECCFDIRISMVAICILDGCGWADENFSQDMEWVGDVIVLIHGKGDAICGAGIVKKLLVEAAYFFG